MIFSFKKCIACSPLAPLDFSLLFFFAFFFSSFLCFYIIYDHDQRFKIPCYNNCKTNGYYQKQPPRRLFKISVLFFLFKFCKRVYLFVEQTCFFQKGLYVLRTDTNFPGGFIEQKCFFKEVLSVRRAELILIEQILIFPKTLI